MSNLNIQGIFPTPIFVGSFYSVNNEERSTLNDFLKNSTSNVGNIISVNKNILDHVNLINLKNKIQEQINLFFKTIYDPSSNVDCFITNSWINLTKKDQFHHPHCHPNSFISGVYYVDVDENNDSITFLKSNNSSFSLTPKNYNLYNSESWNFKVKNGYLILFPSLLTHFVSKKTTDSMRLSISFNSFFKGEIGEGLTYLKFN